MKTKFLKLLPLVLFSLAASGYSDEAPAGGQPPCYDQGHPVPANQMTSGYNSSARIDVEGAWDFYLSGSFIYWQPRMDGLELGTYSFAPPDEPGRVLNSDFDYRPGFKVGLGMNSSFDDWTIFAEYIWIRADEKTFRRIPALAGSTTAFWNTDLFSNFTAVRSKWDHDNNILDVTLGRSHYVGTRLTFLPFIGLRAYWLDQDLDVTYTVSSTTSAISHAMVDSWAVGARAGLQTNWLLAKDFRLIGNVAGSLAYQKFKSAFVEYSVSEALTANLKNRFSKITPNIECAIGLGWGSYFSNKEWHFDFSALYEFHYFWNQNEMKNLVINVDGFPDANAGDLKYQGLTLTARLDF